MTADPKVINDAYVIEHLSYVEAMELCNFRSEGDLSADDLPGLPQKYSDRDPQYVQPGFERHGHFRESSGMPAGRSKGISSINDTCLITIQGLGMVGVIGVNYHGFSKRSPNRESAYSSSRRRRPKIRPRSACATTTRISRWKC